MNTNKILMIILLTSLISCREDLVVTPATYSMLLTGEESKNWQQVSFTFIFDDEEVEPLDANQIYGVPPCEQDNIYTYIREGKSVEIYQGDIKCDPDGDDLIARTNWDIVNASATLFIGGGDPFELARLTDDSLVYGFRDTLALPIGDQTFWDFPGVAQWVYKPLN